MPERFARALVLTGALFTFTACWGSPTQEFPGGPFSVEVIARDTGDTKAIRVSGWSSGELSTLERTPMSEKAWMSLATLRVPGADTPVAAKYVLSGRSVDIVPIYPLDRGRTYEVEVHPEKLPVPRPTSEGKVLVVATPPPGAAEPVRVSAIHPSASVWPENTLRFYLHFTGPMSGTSAIGHVRLVDDRGVEVPEVLLDIDVDLWDTGYTRRTVFFDPGRVKNDIKPNRDLGRALVAGKTYAIVVGTGWKDAGGRPLASEFRHEFTAGSAIDRGLDVKDWTIEPGSPGTSAPLRVTFPWALDAGLLRRAIGVTTDSGTPIDGTIALSNQERTWTFTPTATWLDRTHHLVVLSVLEDPSGNTVGEAFEFEMFGKPSPAAPERIKIPFKPK